MLALLVLATEPHGWPVAAAVAAAGVGAAAIAALVLLRVMPRRRGTRLGAFRSLALRRGAEVGAVVAIVAALQVLRGLTPLTALFVVLSFAIAEYVLSAERSSSR